MIGLDCERRGSYGTFQSFVKPEAVSFPAIMPTSGLLVLVARKSSTIAGVAPPPPGVVHRRLPDLKSTPATTPWPPQTITVLSPVFHATGDELPPPAFA